jgi:hypothetical protein
VDFDKLWRNRRSVVMADSLIEVLCPEHLITLLSIHGASHGWTSLKSTCHVAEFLRKYPELNWLHVLVEARELTCFRMLMITVQSAGELAGIPLPAPIVSALDSENSTSTVCHNVHSRLFSGRPVLGGLDRVLFCIRIRERLRDRLRLAARFVASRLNLASNERL